MSISRRKVLKTLGISATAAWLGQWPGSLNASPLRSPFGLNLFLDNSAPVRAIVLGAGRRGNRFGRFALACPQQLAVIAVAEPVEGRNQQFASQHGLAEACRFSSWEQALQSPKCAEVAIITASNDYVKPCIAALKAGYDVWLDKPVSTDPAVMKMVTALAKQQGRTIAFIYMLDNKLCFMEHKIYTAKVLPTTAPAPAGPQTPGA